MLALRPAALATRTARAARAFRATGRAVARPAFAHARARPAGSPDRRAGVRCRATAAGPRVDNDVVVPGADHASLPKNFEHGDTEERLYQWWEERGCFQPDPNASGEPFCIAMPPPNVTGALHMGHCDVRDAARHHGARRAHAWPPYLVAPRLGPRRHRHAARRGARA
jgi:valyl-tRNA synthetase